MATYTVGKSRNDPERGHHAIMLIYRDGNAANSRWFWQLIMRVKNYGAPEEINSGAGKASLYCYGCRISGRPFAPLTAAMN